jgi:hypothetical protein
VSIIFLSQGGRSKDTVTLKNFVVDCYCKWSINSVSFLFCLAKLGNMSFCGVHSVYINTVYAVCTVYFTW